MKKISSASFNSFPSNTPISGNEHLITIGYYNLRGKAQVCRLLCEYLEVDYKDQMFTLAEWDRWKNHHCKEWPFPCVPFLKQGDFIVTESVPMCIYVIQRFGEPSLLGRNLSDQGTVDMYLWTIQTMSSAISLNCQKKSQQEIASFKVQQWNRQIEPRMIKYEQIAHQNDWFMGYITIIDFSIYQLVRYMEKIFGQQMKGFPKLKTVEKRIAQLSAIKNYEASSKAIVEWCPTKLLEELKSSMAAAQKRASMSSIRSNNLKSQQK